MPCRRRRTRQVEHQELEKITGVQVQDIETVVAQLQVPSREATLVGLQPAHTEWEEQVPSQRHHRAMLRKSVAA